ncbi:hypothetical protein BDW02DRAFT_252799 [Decorospora gaudefroyi]|uniref:Protein kinase domain-containing protein n=1 Tax=Decorospora gaudefroyi TaxID=184978 RepID=A0A6A5JY27_9PLEO|nr:hypothetical protein BDW02DRAFT_252799 [Decorospora gaudefroyi]
MSSSDSIKWRRDIRNTITANLITSKFEKNEEGFMPHGLLEKIFENEKFSIEKILGLTSSNEDQDLLQFVKTSPKLFGIVALCQQDEYSRRRAMQLFKQHHYDDTELPLPEPFHDQDSDRTSVLATFEEDLNNTDEPIWEDWNVKEFFDAQRMFLTPRFDIRKDNEDFDRRIILPFIYKDVMPNKGTFGVLYKMEIHSSHIVGVADGEAFNPLVAVKHIIPKDKEEHQKIIKKWIKEADALRSMNKLRNSHIVRFITAFRQIGSPHNDMHLYLMFEWADGGNLRQLWRSPDMAKQCRSLARAVIEQIKGLASALNHAHNLPEGLQYRHGDLKPENILWFRGNGGLGTLKIGDWGEAKGHNVKTEFRPNNTTAGFGTRRYEASEVVTGLRTGRTGGALNRRSRLYDVWAMGCITLEFLVWLIYGPGGLEIFNASITGDPDTFYQIKQAGVEKVARVHDVAVQWMDDMAQDSSCKVGVTALGNLLEIVRQELLVVEVDYSVATGMPASRPMTPKPAAQSPRNLGVPDPKDTHTLPRSQLTVPNSSGAATKVSRTTQGFGSKPVRGKGRVRSDYFHHRMEEMVTGYDDDDYWSIGSTFRQIPAELEQLADDSRKLSAYRTEYQNTGMSTLDITEHMTIDYGKLRLGRDWTFNFDNGVASSIFQAVRKFGAGPSTASPSTAQLCYECSQLRDHIWRPTFRKLYYRDDLQSVALSGTCQLHSLFWRTCDQDRGAENDTVSFENVNSALRLNGGGDPVLNIVKDHGTVLGMGEEVQISFPELLPAGSHGHLEIVRQWLSHCNEKHINYGCRASKHRSTASGTDRPTRLIYVGEPGYNRVHLYQSTPSDTEPWIALSHQWGPDRSKHFSTNSSNVDDFMEELKFEDLPKTFSDAVKVTQELGCKYLWIDSLCIIQSGPRMDFDREAKRMEMVYSGAYCVLAASCASGHHSGFLQQRNPSEYLRMSTGVGNDANYSICQTIDRFNDHVLEGPLSKRGWVLQEHALARRTIFFTEHQTYFECGGGVRTETMTQMNNNLAALLGDPNFPAILSTAKLGERILRFQALYEQYSRLALSRDWDRPTAIDGLEQRLLSAMQLKGGFGVFDGGETRGLLRRSLLWHRGDEEASLQRIKSVNGKTPSWSWMAYTGGITYFSLDFKMYDWNDVVSPWTDGARGDTALVATARRFELRDKSEAKAKFKMDAGEGVESLQGLCIVLGRYKGDMSVDEKTHYVLLIAPKDNSARDSVVYERIGAGYLLGADMMHEEGEVTIV